MELTDLEIAKIEAFCADREMYMAVKRVILAGIYEHGTIKEGYIPNPLENAAFNLASLAITNPIPDEALGQHIRSMWAGVNAMKNAFDKLEGIKSKGSDSIESPYNIAE